MRMPNVTWRKNISFTIVAHFTYIQTLRFYDEEQEGEKCTNNYGSVSQFQQSMNSKLTPTKRLALTAISNENRC